MQTMGAHKPGSLNKSDGALREIPCRPLQIVSGGKGCSAEGGSSLRIREAAPNLGAAEAALCALHSQRYTLPRQVPASRQLVCLEAERRHSLRWSAVPRRSQTALSISKRSILGIPWEENEYFTPAFSALLRAAIDEAPSDGTHAGLRVADPALAAAKIAKMAPFVMPATHGDVSTPWYDLPAGIGSQCLSRIRSAL